MIASGAFSRHRRGPPGLARRQYPGERSGGMFGVRGAYFAGWITVEIDADRACDKALQIHHTRGVDAQNCAQLAPSENWAAGQDVGADSVIIRWRRSVLEMLQGTQWLKNRPPRQQTGSIPMISSRN